VIPSDPRTWTDFSNPGSSGFLKVDCHTTLERALTFGATMLGIFAAVMLMTAFVEVRGPWLSRDGIAIAVPALIAGAGFLLGLRWLTNNFYLIDRTRHAVYFHFQFLGIRRVRLLLERPDIQAMAVETRHQQHRGRAWWEHRAVLIDVRGRTVPLGDWESEALEVANHLARTLAAELGCRCHESPDDSRLVVRMEHGMPSVTYKPSELEWPGTKPLAIIVVVVMILAAALGVAVFLIDR
jgi:hypothetical protein